MQTENTAPIDQTNAPPAQADASQINQPPASGQADQAQAKPDADTNSAAAQEDKGTQQETDQNGAERDENGRFKSKIQRRIDELTHARHTAEREAARWRAIAEGRQTAAAPKPLDYATDEDYQAAARRHEIQEAAREMSAETARQAAEQYQQDAQRAVADTYAQRAEAAAVRIPDFVEVVGKADIQISNTLRDALVESEHGPDIVYQLAKNPAEAMRLSQLDDRALYRELGRLEAGMLNAKYPPAAAQPAAPVARITSAPPPATVGDLGAAPPNTDPSRMNQAEFEAWMKAQGSKYL